MAPPAQLLAAGLLPRVHRVHDVEARHLKTMTGLNGERSPAAAASAASRLLPHLTPSSSPSDPGRNTDFETTKSLNPLTPPLPHECCQRVLAKRRGCGCASCHTLIFVLGFINYLINY